MLQAFSFSTFCMHLLSYKNFIFGISKINNLKGKKPKVSQVGQWKNNNKKNKSQFNSLRPVSAVIDRFVKQVLKKQRPYILTAVLNLLLSPSLLILLRRLPNLPGERSSNKSSNFTIFLALSLSFFS